MTSTFVKESDPFMRYSYHGIATNPKDDLFHVTDYDVITTFSQDGKTQCGYSYGLYKFHLPPKFNPYYLAFDYEGTTYHPPFLSKTFI